MPKGHFPEPEGRTSGYSIFGDSPFLEYHKDGPRDYAGFGSVPFSAYRKDGPRATGGFVTPSFSPLTKTDLGGVQMSYQHLVTPSGGPKSHWDVWDHLQMDLGVVLKAVGAFRTTSGQTSGVPKMCSPVWGPEGQTSGVQIHGFRSFVPLQTPFRISLCIGATG